MTLGKLCLEYLDALNAMGSDRTKTLMNEKKGFLELLLGDAIDTRLKIAVELECDVNRLMMITDSLDIAIDFMPPLERYDSTKVYARELERLLTCTAGRIFLSGKAYRLTTAYGVIKESVS